MQTIELIETAKWIIATIPKSTLSFLLEGGWQRAMHEGKGDAIGDAFAATHDLAAAAEKLNSHPLAAAVLKEFGLDLIVSREFPIEVSKAFGGGGARELMGGDLANRIFSLSQQWRSFVGVIEPLERLTVPAAVSKEEDFDDILTLEIRTVGEKKPKLEELESLLNTASRLYLAIATATIKGDVSPLQVIYLTSGSGFRFDLKGMGEPIKRLKELLIEIWEKYRHRKSDDLHHNIKAAIKGLDLLNKIGAHKHLEPETRARLNHDISESVFALFEVGALPREVKKIELISNTALIQDFQKKLLPAPDSKVGITDAKKTARPIRKNQKNKS